MSVSDVASLPTIMLAGTDDCDADCSEQDGAFFSVNLRTFNDLFYGPSPDRQMLEIWILSITGAILVGLSGIFPLLVVPLESGPALKHGEPARKLRLMLSFAVGSLLGDVFLHLLPEVWAHMDRDNHSSHTKCGLWVIGGLLAFMIVEKLMGDELDPPGSSDNSPDSSDSSTKSPVSRAKDSQKLTKQIPRNKNLTHNSRNPNGDSHIHQRHIENTAKMKPEGSKDNAYKEVSEEGSKIKVSGYLNLLANVVDNFTHGLAVAASFLISTKVGLATTVAILLHEVPHEVGDFAILLRSGFDRWKAAKAQFLTATGGVFGAVTALTAESAQVAGDRTSWILPFTSGGFMYIALVTVVPDLLQEKRGRESLKQVVCICLGVLSMGLVTILFDA